MSASSSADLMPSWSSRQCQVGRDGRFADAALAAGDDHDVANVRHLEFLRCAAGLHELSPVRLVASVRFTVWELANCFQRSMQIVERVNPGIVPIAPGDLVGVAADGLECAVWGQRCQFSRLENAKGSGGLSRSSRRTAAWALCAELLPGKGRPDSVVPVDHQPLGPISTQRTGQRFLNRHATSPIILKRFHYRSAVHPASGSASARRSLCAAQVSTR